jgi:hypothetical protein
MSFEKLDLGETVVKKSEAPQKEIELSPAMQELYEEITAENVDENQLESEAKKMSAAERFGVLGKAINRAGKLARRIAVVAFAAFSPSMAGSADTLKQVEKDLMSETQNEWQMQKEKSQSNEIKLSPELAARAKDIIKNTDMGTGEISSLEVVLNEFANGERAIYGDFVLNKNISEDQIIKIYKEVVKEKADEQVAQKTELAKSAPESEQKVDLEKLSQRQREDREIMFCGDGDSSHLTSVRFIPLSRDEDSGPSETRVAYRAGAFKNHEEYKEWLKKTNLEKAKRLVGKYAGAVEEIKNNIDVFKNKDKFDDRVKFKGYLEKKYNINEGSNPLLSDRIINPGAVINLLVLSVLDDMGLEK